MKKGKFKKIISVLIILIILDTVLLSLAFFQWHKYSGIINSIDFIDKASESIEEAYSFITLAERYFAATIILGAFLVLIAVAMVVFVFINKRTEQQVSQ